MAAFETIDRESLLALLVLYRRWLASMLKRPAFLGIPLRERRVFGVDIDHQVDSSAALTRAAVLSASSDVISAVLSAQATLLPVRDPLDAQETSGLVKSFLNATAVLVPTIASLIVSLPSPAEPTQSNAPKRRLNANELEELLVIEDFYGAVVSLFTKIMNAARFVSASEQLQARLDVARNQSADWNELGMLMWCCYRSIESLLASLEGVVEVLPTDAKYCEHQGIIGSNSKREHDQVWIVGSLHVLIEDVLRAIEGLIDIVLDDVQLPVEQHAHKPGNIVVDYVERGVITDNSHTTDRIVSGTRNWTR